MSIKSLWHKPLRTIKFAPETTYMGKVHEYLKILRQRKGLSQDEMADKMGIERSTYSNFELGKTNLFSPNLAKAAQVLEVSEDEILIGAYSERGYLSEGGLSDRIDILSAKVEAVDSRLETLTGIVNNLVQKIDARKK